MDNQYLENIKEGMKVEILTKQNRIAKGIIEDIVSRANYQLYGIIVRLKTGEIGRVQKILSPLPKKEEVINKNSFETDIEKLLKYGENYHCEFKLGALWSVNYTEDDIKKSRSFDVHYYKQKASKIIIAKSIAAFLNSDGGNLIIGVMEKKDIKGEIETIGVQVEYTKLKDSYSDGYKRMILDEVIKLYFPSKISNHLNDYLSINFVDINGKTLCWIKIKKSDSRVFLKLLDRDVFMIRTETETRALEGEKLVDYCIRRFEK